MRWVRQIAIAVIAGTILGLIVAYSGKHVIVGLWSGLAAGVIVFLVAVIFDQRKELAVARAPLTAHFAEVRDEHLPCRPFGHVEGDQLVLSVDLDQYQDRGRFRFLRCLVRTVADQAPLFVKETRKKDVNLRFPGDFEGAYLRHGQGYSVRWVVNGYDDVAEMEVIVE